MSDNHTEKIDSAIFPEGKEDEPREREEAITEEEETPQPEEEEYGEEPIEWDGSEATLVMDDAAEYEEAQTGIKLSYILRKQEIFDALKRSGMIKTTGMRAAVEVVLLLCVLVLFCFSYIVTKDNQNLVFGALCVILIAVILILPWVGLNNRAKQAADGRVINMEIYPDSIVMGTEETKWEIPLDGSIRRLEVSNLIVLDVNKSQMVILPLRCVEPAVLPEVEAMIVAGTNKEEKK